MRHCPSGDDPETPTRDETDGHGLSAVGSTTKVGQSGNKLHYDCSGRGVCNFKSGNFNLYLIKHTHTTLLYVHAPFSLLFSFYFSFLSNLSCIDNHFYLLSCIHLGMPYFHLLFSLIIQANVPVSLDTKAQIVA